MFVTEGPLHPDSPLYVGRAADLARMESWLAHVHCVGGLLGARQTGKTSLLLRLRASLQDRFAFAYINLEGITGEDVAQSCRYIARELVEQLAPVLPGFDCSLPDCGADLVLFLRELARDSQAVRIAVLLDEIGALLPETGFRIAHIIRAVFTERQTKPEYGRYVFLLCGARDMLELATGRTSPISNVMQRIYVEDLTKDQTSALLARGLSDGGLVPSPSLCEAVYYWTNGHPYLTQLMGSLLCKSGTDPNMQDVGMMIGTLLEEEDKNLPHLRRSLDKGGTRLWDKVEAVIKGRSVPFSRTDSVVAELELIGAIRDEGGRCHIRNPIYQQAIKEWLGLSDDVGVRLSLERLQDLADSVRQDLRLLKEYEDALRYEQHPLRRAEFKEAIERIRRRALHYKDEHDLLRAEAGKRSVPDLQGLEVQLKLIRDQLETIVNQQSGLAGDLERVHQSLLERYDAQERAVLAAVTRHLDHEQVERVQGLLDVIETGLVPLQEMQQILDTLKATLEELGRQGVVVVGQDQVASAFANPSADVKHKLKLALPFIPYVLTYEAEIALGSRADLALLWQQLIERLRGRNRGSVGAVGDG